MGKFKKMLAGMLSAAMVMSTMTVSAFAAQTKTPSTIDITKEGSITIHKYEYNGDGGTTGNGSENEQAPDGARPLKDAGFTIYKVANEEDLERYYSTNPAALPSVGDYTTKDGKIKTEYAKGQVGKEITTGTDGIAKFEHLALGFYVVVETKTPDKVTTAVEPFLVSVPMTTTDGDNWLYDVHVYPKNKTTYGGVTLEKQGNTENDKLAGVTFVLQKKTEDTWTNVTTSESNGKDLTLVTDKNGQISVDGLSKGTYRFIETDRGDDNYGYIMDGATTYEFVVGADGKITYKDETKKNITITVKNEKPDLTKEVKDRTDSTWGQDSDYNVGDMVPYKITVKVPSNITKLKYFTVTDTPTNLKDDDSTVEVKDGDAAVAKEAYTVAEVGNGFTVKFDPIKMAFYEGKELVITYRAELLSAAKTTTDGNSNIAKLEYSNKILPNTGDPGTDTIEDKAIVYTFKLNIIKKANSVEGKALNGVKFDLYKEVPAGTEGAATAEQVEEAGLNTSKTWLRVAQNLTTKDKGEVSCSGLANGTYYLVETKTVDGYNLLKAPVEVNLKVEYVTTTENGVTKTVFTENSEPSNGTHSETIINKNGFQLPTTGGMGTLLFSVIGVIVMIAAAFILLKGRKKEA